ncbi:tRNA (adenosine(37)-N6)-threonylcarbamoyltransferase complex transferase subunit TsaD [bacterium]|nr:tRNA (adenosine(37)-N6)-threonylcarbamoyltransferase complex transferase subunit TsaD [bacterium]
MKESLVLAVETSCDETGVAVMEGRKVLFEALASQLDLHRQTQGVVPEVASRRQAEVLPFLLKRAQKAVPFDKIELFAVTNSPGLLGSLLCGVNFVKMLGFLYRKPTLGVDHLLAHFFSPFLNRNAEIRFPALGLVVSGGHTVLLWAEKSSEIRIIGETLDDAVGEALDKIARLLNLPYPGGPEIERLAKTAKDTKVQFPPPMLKSNDFNFSYSGLKTAVLYYLRKHPAKTKTEKAQICRAVLESAFLPLVEKSYRAVREFKPEVFLMGGGVSINSFLRQWMKERLSEILPSERILFAPKKYCTDNAVMVGLSAQFLLSKAGPWYTLKASPQSSLYELS